jgi:hypothetical protein
VALTVHVPEKTREKFRRAREIASRKAKASLTEGQTFDTVLEHYLDDFDPDRVKPGKRRMPTTRGLSGRNVPAEVRRKVLGRYGGRCAYPGCRNRIWIDLAHDEAHRHGGCREADNLHGLCPYHHRAFDRGEFMITGPPDAPTFYDARGRRILSNGRVEEEPRGNSDEGLEGRGDRNGESLGRAHGPGAVTERGQPA